MIPLSWRVELYPEGPLGLCPCQEMSRSAKHSIDLLSAPLNALSALNTLRTLYALSASGTSRASRAGRTCFAISSRLIWLVLQCASPNWTSRAG